MYSPHMLQEQMTQALRVSCGHSVMLAKRTRTTVLRKGDISCARVNGTVTYMVIFLRRAFV